MDSINLFMVVNFDPKDSSIGVTKKLLGTIAAFRRKGINTYYTAYAKGKIEIYDNSDSVIFSENSKLKNDQLSAAFRRFQLLFTTRHFLDKTNINFDIVFLRWIGFDIPYLRVLKCIKEKHHSYVIVDMHSYFDGIRYTSLKGRYMVANTKWFSDKASSYIDTFLTEGDVKQLFGKPTVHASIGVDIDALREHIYRGNKDEINMISVANELLYHGYDRLVNSLAHYYEDVDNHRIINVHLVGVISDSTKKLIHDKGVSNHVFMYGKQYGDALFDIYDKCNMAVGPLAQHRVGGKKGTGLKTKEYFGIGIPYFYAGEDVSIPENYKYTYEVPSDESLIDFNKIEEFYLSYYGKSNVSAEMRKYARDNYSWDSITDTFLAPYYSQGEK